MKRRHLLLATAVASALTLSGCASLNMLSSDVSSYGEWPAGRAPGRYFIEQLPSQVASAQRSGGHQTLQQAAHAALQRAGFTQAPDLASADVVVQIGARVTVYDVSPWADPLWWRWGPTYWRGPGWVGPGWGGVGWVGPGWVGPGWSRGSYWRTPPLPEREVAILLRDRAGSVPLWEARATSSGSSTDAATLEAMFTAAMSDFPKAVPQSRRVSVPLSR